MRRPSGDSGEEETRQVAFRRQGMLPNTRKQIVPCFSPGHLLRSGWAASSTDCWRVVGVTCPGMEAAWNLRLLQGASGQGSIPPSLCSAEFYPLFCPAPITSPLPSLSPGALG